MVDWGTKGVVPYVKGSETEVLCKITFNDGRFRWSMTSGGNGLWHKMYPAIHAKPHNNKVSQCVNSNLENL